MDGKKNGWVVRVCMCELRSIQSALNYHSSTVCVCVFDPGSFLMCVAAG